MRKIMLIAAGAVATLGLAACDVEQTEEGALPDVQVEGGNMPEFDVDAAPVEITTEEQTVDVPVVNVGEADAGAPGEE